MKSTITIILYLIVLPLFIIWLLFCGVIAFFGLFFHKKFIPIDFDGVKKKDTICSVLNSKGLLSDEEYAFETKDVAGLYDELIFRGYLFVLRPIIVLLKYTNFANDFILYLVHRWMEVHNYKQKQKTNSFFTLLFKFCVNTAGRIGQVLHRVKPK